nr:DUF3253 domain-containing protein [Enterovirga rhinocerotis]
MPSEDDLERTILDLVAERGAGKTICPSEAARALAGKEPDAWGRVMPLVRRTAVRLTKEGRVAIRRKGKVVDPDDFRGVYRIGPAEAGE